MEFFNVPKDIIESSKNLILVKGESIDHINIENFYDYETNSYIQNFKN